MGSHYIPDATDDSPVDLRAMQIPMAELAKDFMLAGNSTFTLRSKKSQNRFTFKLRRKKDWDKEGVKIWIASLMNGPNNEEDFVGFGFVKLFPDGEWDYYHWNAARGRPSRSSESVAAFGYTVFNILRRSRIPDDVEFWHEGRCGRCGRTLTDPASIDRGFGPECVNHIGG